MRCEFTHDPNVSVLILNFFFSRRIESITIGKSGKIENMKSLIILYFVKIQCFVTGKFSFSF